MSLNVYVMILFPEQTAETNINPQDLHGPTAMRPRSGVDRPDYGPRWLGDQ